MVGLSKLVAPIFSLKYFKKKKNNWEKKKWLYLKIYAGTLFLQVVHKYFLWNEASLINSSCTLYCTMNYRRIHTGCERYFGRVTTPLEADWSKENWVIRSVVSWYIHRFAQGKNDNLKIVLRNKKEMLSQL